MLGLAQSSLAEFTSSHRDHTVTNYSRHCASEIIKTPMCTTLPHVEVLRAYQNQDSQPTVNNLDQCQRLHELNVCLTQVHWWTCYWTYGSLVASLWAWVYLVMNCAVPYVIWSNITLSSFLCTRSDDKTAGGYESWSGKEDGLSHLKIYCECEIWLNVRYDWILGSMPLNCLTNSLEIYNKFVNPNTALLTIKFPLAICCLD